MAASSEKYTEEQLQVASGWLQAQSEGAVGPPPSLVDVSTLNEAQAIVYNAVLDHEAKTIGNALEPPLRAILNGTADSGKMYLIRALKQQIGEKCLVMALTGIDRADITPRPARLKALQLKFRGVSHVIFDKMSMIGRRSLDFGGLNVILCGDHGQLPPVKDCRCFDAKSRRYLSGPRKREFVPSAPPWQERGFKVYNRIVESGYVFFLDTIERATARANADAGELARLKLFKEV
eukprot:4636626-Pleurochrysis_carterae.AAC.1